MVHDIKNQLFCGLSDLDFNSSIFRRIIGGIVKTKIQNLKKPFPVCTEYGIVGRRGVRDSGNQQRGSEEKREEMRDSLLVFFI